MGETYQPQLGFLNHQHTYVIYIYVYIYIYVKTSESKHIFLAASLVGFWCHHSPGQIAWSHAGAMISSQPFGFWWFCPYDVADMLGTKPPTPQNSFRWPLRNTIWLFFVEGHKPKATVEVTEIDNQEIIHLLPLGLLTKEYRFQNHGHEHRVGGFDPFFKKIVKLDHFSRDPGWK